LLREGIMISRLNRMGIGTGGAPVPVLFFACAAHFMHHVLVSLFLTLVISLTVEWGRGYAELIVLWTLGSLMIGLGAPLAGWLGDRWGESRVMVLLFFGLGLASIACGLALPFLMWRWRRRLLKPSSPDLSSCAAFRAPWVVASG
jgi:MFS family permease